MLTRFAVQFGVFAATNCFPSGHSSYDNKCACCEDVETIDDVLENLFRTFFTCSRQIKSTFAICVSKGLVSCNRTCSALRSEIALFLYIVRCSQRNVLVILVVFGNNYAINLSLFGGRRALINSD